jgi:hypothetical protein
MEPDFSGYATKAGLKCSDGRTIMPDAFKENDGQKVPLVWQHGHNEPSNVLGHALLENRNDGVYTYAFFNGTDSARSAKVLVQHGDITALSIYANKLVEKGKSVVHGAIREVSLVLSGANPGAFIDNVALAHADGEVETLDDEAIIYTGLFLEHESKPDVQTDDEDDDEQPVESAPRVQESNKPADAEPDSAPLQVGEDKGGNQVEHAGAEPTVQDVYDSLSDEQKSLVHYMIGAALEAANADSTDSTDTAQHSDNPASDTNEGDLITHQEGTDMTRNVFEQAGEAAATAPTLSHSQVKTIVDDGPKYGSLKESFLAHAVEYGIEDIDILFPDAKAVSNSPEVIGRRQEWVQDVINNTKHSPFSRIKSTAVDLTADEARAKGYVKGNLKKDEIIKLLKRVTTPTTIYKKQKLDRDDVVDITDLDVVAWLKAEMRVMLDEELARAVLIGDGRESDDEDKIDEDHLRPIAYDADMYAHQLVVASDLDADGTVEAILRARTYYKGTGTPTLYTTDGTLTDLILQKDKVGRRLFETEEALAAALRVGKVVTVEVMDDAPEVVAILVNLADYTLGADRGGNVAMFDDFDIDYNQYKYLIETRVSGALTKPKSAIVVKRTLGTVVSPQSPSYDGATHTITFPATDGVVYSVEGETKTGTLTINETTEVEARPASNYSFPPNTNRDWTFVYTA